MKAPSAKPLFRAIKGRKSHAGDALPMHLPKQDKPKQRRALDFYPTGQHEATTGLLRADGHLWFDDPIWENAVGDGGIANVLQDAGKTVIGSDVVDRGWDGTIVKSFYDFEESLAPVLVGNPPYCEINARDGHGRWLRHTLGMKGWRYCALLLSWDWPAAHTNGLGALLDEHPFSWCYLMRWKLDFTGEGSPPQRNAWFVWDRGHVGPSQFRLMDKPKDRHPQFDFGGDL